MSLVRSADSSTTSRGESNLYARKSSNDGSNIANPLFGSDRRMFHYGTDSYCSETYDQQYPSRPSTRPTQHIGFTQSSSSAVSGSLFLPQISSTPYPLRSDFMSSDTTPFHSYYTANGHPCSLSANMSDQTSGSVLNSQSPDYEMTYDEAEVRSKLQELERELLNDNDGDLLDSEEEIGIDEEWLLPMKNLLLPDSPNESSSDSNISVDSSKEIRTPKQILFYCAASISEGNLEEASTMITELRQMVSIQGDPQQRLAAYMVEGLAARMASSGKGIYEALKCKEPPTPDRLSAMQILFEVCPCFKFGFMAANGAIAEAFKDEQKVHIIDFDVNQGSQYITLMQALSTKASKPKLRLTGVDDPESVQRAVGGLKVIGQRLEMLAQALGISFEFHAIAAKTEDVTPSMLACRPGEALVVNFAFQLHHMPDESVSTVNQRDRLLRMVKSLEPKLVTVVEQDANTNTAPFFQRFVEVYNYYLAVFESLDVTLPRESADRMNVERQCLAKDIVNIVACEGTDRIERYEAAGKWRARMTMAGFVSCPLSSYVNEAIRKLLKSYCDRYKVKEEGGTLYFGWEDKILVVTSAWK